MKNTKDVTKFIFPTCWSKSHYLKISIEKLNSRIPVVKNQISSMEYKAKFFLRKKDENCERNLEERMSFRIWGIHIQKACKIFRNLNIYFIKTPIRRNWRKWKEWYNQSKNRRILSSKPKKDSRLLIEKQTKNVK